ncbi:DUF4870 domain-containing protein [Flavobacterium restrictum]|uniref:DUF4870 domain-containing protein n=1 Tax=Flavobacterium restrictum TaxID=2594428 RepID=A0A553E2A1_9FLAO|nr:DUF4870 domain-containing protein [Flavobacterium restrictum]TRX39166.1 DUF4870 domain-containing protein [Flavobacterium restrictum]
METTTEKNTATFTHLSTLSQYVFPFGNYIFPILIWSTKKDKSEFVDHHGKQAINFQLSLLIYTLILAAIALPILIYTVFKDNTFSNFDYHTDFPFESIHFQDHIGIITVGLVAVFVFFCMKIAEFFLIIYASIQTSNGKKYKYPLTIPFLK